MWLSALKDNSRMLAPHQYSLLCPPKPVISHYQSPLYEPLSLKC